jgi:hypothetical protein
VEVPAQQGEEGGGVVTLTQDLRTRRRHRGLTPWQLIQKIGRMEREADVRDCQLMGLATENAELRDDRNRLQHDFDGSAIDYSGAIEDLGVSDEENALLRAENARLWAELANATAVTVPPMERDTGAIEDQATAPAGIDVRPLWDALDTSRPRQTTWGRDVDDTRPLPRINPAA